MADPRERGHLRLVESLQSKREKHETILKNKGLPDIFSANPENIISYADDITEVTSENLAQAVEHIPESFWRERELDESMLTIHLLEACDALPGCGVLQDKLILCAALQKVQRSSINVVVDCYLPRYRPFISQKQWMERFGYTPVDNRANYLALQKFMSNPESLATMHHDVKKNISLDGQVIRISGTIPSKQEPTVDQAVGLALSFKQSVESITDDHQLSDIKEAGKKILAKPFHWVMSAKLPVTAGDVAEKAQTMLKISQLLHAEMQQVLHSIIGDNLDGAKTLAIIECTERESSKWLGDGIDELLQPST